MTMNRVTTLEDEIISVYGLIDPQDGAVFYVGIAGNVPNRVAQHMTDRTSAAWPRCQQIKARGDDPAYCLFAAGIFLSEGRVFEAGIIRLLPDLDNKQHRLPYDQQVCARSHNLPYGRATYEKLGKLLQQLESTRCTSSPSSPSPVSPGSCSCV